MLYYDLNLSEAKNREKLLQYGLNLSDGTIRNRSKECDIPTSSTSPSPKSSIRAGRANLLEDHASLLFGMLGCGLFFGQK